MWGGKFWRIGEAARSYSSIEHKAGRVGGAAWGFPEILRKMASKMPFCSSPPGPVRH
jgi:hypothetical protein